VFFLVEVLVSFDNHCLGYTACLLFYILYFTEGAILVVPPWVSIFTASQNAAGNWHKYFGLPDLPCPEALGETMHLLVACL